MNWLIVADYDSDRKFFNTSWRAHSEKYAVAKYGDDINEVVKLRKHSFDVNDHSLYFLGTIDDSSGIIIPCAPRKLVDASHFIVRDDNCIHDDEDDE